MSQSLVSNSMLRPAIAVAAERGPISSLGCLAFCFPGVRFGHGLAGLLLLRNRGLLAFRGWGRRTRRLLRWSCRRLLLLFLADRHAGKLCLAHRAKLVEA